MSKNKDKEEDIKVRKLARLTHITKNSPRPSFDQGTDAFMDAWLEMGNQVMHFEEIEEEEEEC